MAFGVKNIAGVAGNLTGKFSGARVDLGIRCLAFLPVKKSGFARQKTKHQIRNKFEQRRIG